MSDLLPMPIGSSDNHFSSSPAGSILSSLLVHCRHFLKGASHSAAADDVVFSSPSSPSAAYTRGSGSSRCNSRSALLLGLALTLSAVLLVAFAPTTAYRAALCTVVLPGGAAVGGSGGGSNHPISNAAAAARHPNPLSFAAVDQSLQLSSSSSPSQDQSAGGDGSSALAVRETASKVEDVAGAAAAAAAVWLAGPGAAPTDAASAVVTADTAATDIPTAAASISASAAAAGHAELSAPATPSPPPPPPPAAAPATPTPTPTPPPTPTPTPTSAPPVCPATPDDGTADKKHYRPPCERMEPGAFDQSSTPHTYPTEAAVLAQRDGPYISYVVTVAAADTQQTESTTTTTTTPNSTTNSNTTITTTTSSTNHTPPAPAQSSTQSITPTITTPPTTPATVPRIGLLTYITEAHFLSSRNSLSTRACYASRHGYHNLVESYSLQADRVCHWNKLRSIQKYLPYYDWLLWADADVIVANHSRSLLHDVIGPITAAREAAGIVNTDIIVQVSNHGMSLIDAGSFLIRNSAWSREFVTRWMAMSDNKSEWYDHDNGALHVALQDSLPTNPSLNCTAHYRHRGEAFEYHPKDNRACWTRMFDANMPYEHAHFMSFPHPAEAAGFSKQPASGIRLTQYAGDDKVGKLLPTDFLYHTKNQESFFTPEMVYCLLTLEASLRHDAVSLP